MNTLKWSPYVLIVLALGLTLRVVFLVLVPVSGPSMPGKLSAYNDEAAHANYVRHIVSTRGLPGNVESIQEQDALLRAQYENYQPPLFYGLIAILCGVFHWYSVDAITYTGRAVCLLIGVGLWLVMFRIARLLELDQTSIEAIAAFLALNAVFVRYTVTVSNDALFWLFVGYAVWIALAARYSNKLRRPWIAFCLISVLGLYTKMTFLLVIPLVIFVFERKNITNYILKLALAVLIIFILTGPVWLRNIREFGGMIPLAAGFGLPEWQIPSFASLAFVIRSAVFPWSEFWQGFLGLLFFFPAWMLFSWSFYTEWRRHQFERQPVLIAILAFSLLGFIWLNLRYNQAEARYLYAAWPALCVGICRLPSPAYRWILAAAMLFPYGLFFTW